MFVFLPPNHSKLAQIHQRFFDVGIYRVWMNEYFAWGHSGRDQDRSKVSNRRKLVKKSGRNFSLIGFNRKLLNSLNFWECQGLSFLPFL